MTIIKKLLLFKGIKTENVNMFFAVIIFLTMILWGVFNEIIVKQINKYKNETKDDESVDDIPENSVKRQRRIFAQPIQSDRMFTISSRVSENDN